MTAINALSAAVSGLVVNSSKVAATADNIANVHTQGYGRVDVQAKSIPPQHGGGVTGVVSREKVANLIETVGGVPRPSVDVAAEFTTLIEAKAAYKANLTTIETADEMLKESVDLIG